MSACAACGTKLEEATAACPSCGRMLAGTRQVALEPLQEEATVAFGLLKSAALHPILGYVLENGEPRPVDPEVEYGRDAGLLVPVTTPFGVFVPEEEEEEARRILADARAALPAEEKGA